MKSLPVAIATFALSTAALTGIALAHARFVSSTPAPGQTLQASPANVTITFTEELGAGSTGTVTDSGGARVDTAATIDANQRTKLVITLKPAQPNGVYKVSWHSISDDDKAVLDGFFFFGVGVAAPSTSTEPGPDPRPLALALLAAAALVAALSLRMATSRPHA